MSPPLASRAARNLRSTFGGFEAHEVAQALVVLAAGRATLQMLMEPGQSPIRVLTGELEVDVLVE
jgi:hypothetical protein